MKDIQNLYDNRRISIRKVGVKTISYPVAVLDKEHRVQKTIATVNMYVNLPHRFKGAHMSRFVEILNRFHGEINLKNFHHVLREMKEKLEAQAAHMEIQFPYFLQRGTGPDSIGTERYECRMHGSLRETDDLVLEITLPIFTPPALRATGGLPSSPGRWGTAKIAVRFNHFIWIEDLIAMVEDGLARGGGAPLSVEAVTADLGRSMAGNSAISWYNIRVENLADGYSTFASLEGEARRRPKRGDERTDDLPAKA